MISASRKAAPIDTPNTAMDTVRDCGRVRSASKAVTAAEMAPAPCKARPMITVVMLSACAASRLPATKISKPATITGLRPIRSDAMPKGICSSA